MTYQIPDPARRPTCALPPPGSQETAKRPDRKGAVVRCLKAAKQGDLAVEFLSRTYGLTGVAFTKVLREYVVIEGEGR